jgi:hypothetical protein
MQGARCRPYDKKGSNAADARLGVRGCLWSPLTPCGDVGVWAQGGVARPGKGTAPARTRAWARLRTRARGEAPQRSQRFAPPAGSHFEGSALQRRIPNAIVAHAFHVDRRSMIELRLDPTGRSVRCSPIEVKSTEASSYPIPGILAVFWITGLVQILFVVSAVYLNFPALRGASTGVATPSPARQSAPSESTDRGSK